LLRFQLEPALHPDLIADPSPAAGQPMAPYDEQLEIVPDALTPTSPTRFTVTLPDESTRDYFVDPYRLEVLGSVDPDRTTLSGAAVLIHGELMAGSAGAYLGDSERPTSDAYTGSVANLDTAIVVAGRVGLARPFTVVLPTGTRACSR
jgi:uncharacterized iron-regulated membrane protein